MKTKPVPELLDPVPRNVQEARKSRDSERWFQAEKEHMEKLVALGVFELVSLPPGARAIKCGWVYKARRNELGLLTELTGRGVARGYTQIEGIDYFFKYSPVVRHP